MRRWFQTTGGKWHIAHPRQPGLFAASLCGRPGPVATREEEPPAEQQCKLCLRIAVVWNLSG